MCSANINLCQCLSCKLSLWGRPLLCYFCIEEWDGVVNFRFISELYAACIVSAIKGCEWVSLVFLNYFKLIFWVINSSLYFKGVVHIPPPYLGFHLLWGWLYGPILMIFHVKIWEHYWYWAPHRGTLYLLVVLAIKHQVCCRQNKFKQIHNILQCELGTLMD